MPLSEPVRKSHCARHRRPRRIGGSPRHRPFRLYADPSGDGGGIAPVEVTGRADRIGEPPRLSHRRLAGGNPRMPGSRRTWLLGSLGISAVTTGAMGLASSMPAFLALRFTGGAPVPSCWSWRQPWCSSSWRRPASACGPGPFRRRRRRDRRFSGHRVRSWQRAPGGAPYGMPSGRGAGCRW